MNVVGSEHVNESGDIENKSVLTSIKESSGGVQQETDKQTSEITNNTGIVRNNLSDSSKMLMRTPSLIDDYLSDIERGSSARSENADEISTVSVQPAGAEIKNEPVKIKVIVCMCMCLIV